MLHPFSQRFGFPSVLLPATLFRYYILSLCFLYAEYDLREYDLRRLLVQSMWSQRWSTTLESNCVDFCSWDWKASTQNISAVPLFFWREVKHSLPVWNMYCLKHVLGVCSDRTVVAPCCCSVTTSGNYQETIDIYNLASSRHYPEFGYY